MAIKTLITVTEEANSLNVRIDGEEKLREMAPYILAAIEKFQPGAVEEALEKIKNGEI